MANPRDRIARRDITHKGPSAGRCARTHLPLLMVMALAAGCGPLDFSGSTGSVARPADATDAVGEAERDPEAALEAQAETSGVEPSEPESPLCELPGSNDYRVQPLSIEAEPITPEIQVVWTDGVLISLDGATCTFLENDTDYRPPSGDQITCRDLYACGSCTWGVQYRELSGEGGWTLEPRSSEDCPDYLGTLYGNPNRLIAYYFDEPDAPTRKVPTSPTATPRCLRDADCAQGYSCDQGTGQCLQDAPGCYSDYGCCEYCGDHCSYCDAIRDLQCFMDCYSDCHRCCTDCF